MYGCQLPHLGSYYSMDGDHLTCKQFEAPRTYKRLVSDGGTLGT